MTDGDGEQPSRLCERCGAFGDLPHTWIEGDCILPHREHSTQLLDGTHICQPCIRRHRDWLTEIIDLYAQLADVVLTGSIPDDTAQHDRQKVTGSPSPLRLTAWALLKGVNDHLIEVDYVNGQRVETVRSTYLGSNLPDIPAILTGWAQALYDDTYEQPTTAPSTVAGAAAVLNANAETLAALPDIDTYDAELRWVRRALRQAHGITNPQPLGNCLSVDCRGVVWRQQGGGSCDRCHRQYGKLDLVRLRGHERTKADAEPSPRPPRRLRG